jgi:hypothetical protein
VLTSAFRGGEIESGFEKFRLVASAGIQSFQNSSPLHGSYSLILYQDDAAHR